MSSDAQPPSPIGTIFRKELLELFRDRRAVFFAFVLPLFLYPLMFLGTSTLSKSHQDEIETKELTIGVSGFDLDFAGQIRESDNLKVVEAEPDEEKLRTEQISAYLVFDVTKKGTMRAVRHFLQTVPASREAHVRTDRVLERLRRSLLEEKFEAMHKTVSIAEVVRVEEVDVSLASERSAAGLGKFLPTLLILLLMTGGAFAAIDLVAGEKERGTLETLYVQSISAAQIAAGKFLVVLVASLASVVLNLAGLAISVASGITPTGFGGEALAVPPLGDLAIVLMLLLPFAVLTSAILLAMSSYARSYREAQTYLLPLTIVILVPVGLAAAPQIELSSIVSVVPVANVALATREAVSGQLDVIPMLAVLLSTCVYAGLTLRVATELLKREEVVLVLEPPPLATDASDFGRRRRALIFGSLFLLWIYFASTWLQAPGRFDFLTGVALTLWGAVLIPALVYPFVTRRPFLKTLGLCRPRVGSLLLVIPLAAATSIVMSWYFQLQQIFLPVPEVVREWQTSLEATLQSENPLLLFFVLAISPGVCEELVWRGAIQGDLEARGRRWGTVLLVAFFFGVFHFSSYRFVPTAAVGGVLAIIRMRSASLWPCILFHTAYNGITAFWVGEHVAKSTGGYRWMLDPWCVLVCVGLIVLSLWGLRSRRDTGSNT